MPVGQTPDERFADAVGSFGVIKSPVVLAVSGGSDSTALMQLAARMLPPAQLVVVTVDHGLRPEAAQEIAEVAHQAEMLGLRHEIANWQWNGKGNLQAEARRGRFAALAKAAKAHGATWVWLGHTEDDQIETALMRLARGSGVDGLTGMYPQARRNGLLIGRPLLGIGREALRQWLSDHGIGWSDDPSNENPRFDRVRTRQMMAQLQSLGLTRKRLLQTIDHMQAAHVSLQEAARGFAQRYVRQDTVDLLLAPEVLAVEKADAPRRVLAAALAWISSRHYRPRFDQLREAAFQVRDGRTVTLAGVIMSPQADGWARLTREAAATASVEIGQDAAREHGATWDKRWFLEGPLTPGLSIRALGDSVRDCPDWRASGLPRASLLGSPSVWQGETLLAAPLARLSNGWSARIVADFHSTAFAIED